MNQIILILIAACVAVVPVTIIFVITMKVIRKAHEKEISLWEKEKYHADKRHHYHILELEADIRIMTGCDGRWTLTEQEAIKLKWMKTFDARKINQEQMFNLANVNAKNQSKP